MRLSELEEIARELNSQREAFYAELVQKIPGVEEIIKWKAQQKREGLGGRPR